jgi:hypothetical protein
MKREFTSIIEKPASGMSPTLKRFPVLIPRAALWPKLAVTSKKR